ncbi:hypothetical protein JRQ81_008607 [Phrynocephalus forsythii]|uniref:Lipocalin/cytosolic fatty-acid binding domain-containing protein n=1 Tax=Phrynocephalus forsythii TaxID=171643 RepID=A0A9Q0XAE0_9SAUR|nr:hypothetical protein JRQ81_008607 [Phrynocephalus forsythii]
MSTPMKERNFSSENHPTLLANKNHRTTQTLPWGWVDGQTALRMKTGSVWGIVTASLWLWQAAASSIPVAPKVAIERLGGKWYPMAVARDPPLEKAAHAYRIEPVGHEDFLLIQAIPRHGWCKDESHHLHATQGNFRTSDAKKVVRFVDTDYDNYHIALFGQGPDAALFLYARGKDVSRKAKARLLRQALRWGFKASQIVYSPKTGKLDLLWTSHCPPSSSVTESRNLQKDHRVPEQRGAVLMMGTGLFLVALGLIQTCLARVDTKVPVQPGFQYKKLEGGWYAQAMVIRGFAPSVVAPKIKIFPLSNGDLDMGRNQKVLKSCQFVEHRYKNLGEPGVFKVSGRMIGRTDPASIQEVWRCCRSPGGHLSTQASNKRRHNPRCLFSQPQRNGDIWSRSTWWPRTTLTTWCCTSRAEETWRSISLGGAWKRPWLPSDSSTITGDH